MFGTGTEREASDEALVEAVGQLHGIICSATEKALAAVRELERREAFRVDGCQSMAGWLQLRTGFSNRTAWEWVRVARQLEEMPSVAAAFESGRLSWDQLKAVTSLIADAGLDESDAAADAVGRTAAELERLAREARRVSDEQAEDRKREEHLRLRFDREGMLRIHGRLADERGVAVKQAIERELHRVPVERDDTTPIPYEERCADALVLLAGVRIADDADPDRATVTLHVDAGVFAGDPSGLAQLELGTIVSRATAERLSCDGRCQVSLDDHLGRTVAVTKTVRTVPPWLRRRVLHRDGGCRWPGCGRTALVHAHHLRHWAHEGPTEEGNLVALCWFHHRVVHEGGWRIEGDPAVALRFVGPRGRVLATGPPPLRPEVRERLGRMLLLDEPPAARHAS